ncbi:FAD-dependent monooxygenase [Rhodococcoides kyotonense]|uniref:2-polyprenyl-6-methoxyphenol hydroxylase n=1 Tax=Rhodococcoides kyotonense TaxID=398843 RepID=A0A239KG20_9NOCA|nr:FAD-dependent monooxygenase [Rhodococcus kyotonensis]SNT16074.1 2-polyprenyl-6-methoxyphenol hydroxylase [Rhodococcus kyotonensis]
MKLDRVAVVGGGPGGLYAARLLKLSNPAADITVYEQSSPDTTFGFGVGLASRTQRNLRAADAVSLDAIVAESYSHEMSMQVGDRTARLAHGDLLAIARTSLLSILQEQALAAGVRLEFGTRCDPADLDADVVIAADGINSATRQAEPAFGADTTTGSGLYLWCGTDFALSSAIFVPVTTEHGTFVAHAYPYAPDRSTFLIETNEETWRRAGFDTIDDPTGDSDEASLRYLEKAFAETLQGHELIGNRTRWMRFRTVSCRNWAVGNVVLLGDAAHTAHYSIGSGTKLAMEDAIALDDALAHADTVTDALVEYERVRRPAVEHLQQIARRSEHWWESFPLRMHLPVEQLMVAYMTRAGKVGLERFLESAPAVAWRGIAAYAQVDAGSTPSDITAWVLEQPLNHASATFTSRIAPAELRDEPSTTVLSVDVESAWNEKATALVDEASACATVWLTGLDDRAAVLTRLDVAERMMMTSGALVVVEVPEACRPDAVAGLVSARTHLVSVES